MYMYKHITTLMDIYSRPYLRISIFICVIQFGISKEIYIQYSKINNVTHDQIRNPKLDIFYKLQKFNTIFPSTK